MSRRSCSSVDEVNFSSRAGSHCSYSMSISSRCTSIHFLPAEWHQLKLHFNLSEVRGATEIVGVYLSVWQGGISRVGIVTPPAGDG